MKQYTYNEIRNIYNRFNYQFYIKPYSINLCAIRYDSNSKQEVNIFNDIFYTTYVDDKGNQKCNKYKCTTDPGLYFLKNPMEPVKGTASIYEGQYIGVWQYSCCFHGQPFLNQVKPFTIYRDNNRDNKFDYDVNNLTSGLYGLLFHPHFQQKEEAEFVYNSSAGCIVPKTMSGFNEIMNTCKLQLDRLKINSFTFTLFNVNDLI